MASASGAFPNACTEACSTDTAGEAATTTGTEGTVTEDGAATETEPTEPPDFSDEEGAMGVGGEGGPVLEGGPVRGEDSGTGDDAASADPTDRNDASGSSVGALYESEGRFITTSHAGGSRCTVFRPTDLSAIPQVILWGNGTGSSPANYIDLLVHWASWGFFVIAANTENSGTGEDMLQCLDWLETSPFADQVDLTAVGTSGHSQGGGGSIMAGTDPRVSTTAPIEAYTLGLGHDASSHTRQHGPMLILSGADDTIVPPSDHHSTLFQRTQVPTFWATLGGATHSEPRGDGGRFRGITTAWFAYQLQDDHFAAGGFEGTDCAFCNDPDWEVQQKPL